MMKSKTITVLKCEPGKHPEVCTIDNTLDSLYYHTNCNCVQCIDLDGHTTIVCDDEAKLKSNTLPNRELGWDVIFGTFLIVGFDASSGDFCSLTKGSLNKYSKKFYNYIHTEGLEPSDFDDLRDATCRVFFTTF